MSETLETVLRAFLRTLAAAAGLSPSRMHQLGKLTVLQTVPRNAVTSANISETSCLRADLPQRGHGLITQHVSCMVGRLVAVDDRD